MCVQRRYRRERGPGYNLWKRCQVGRWDRKKNAALTDCALNKGDTRLLMAVKIPPNEMTGIQCREMDIQRGWIASGRMDDEDAGYNPAE